MQRNMERTGLLQLSSPLSYCLLFCEIQLGALLHADPIVLQQCHYSISLSSSCSFPFIPNPLLLVCTQRLSYFVILLILFFFLYILLLSLYARLSSTRSIRM